MEVGNKIAVNSILRDFKTETGLIKYEAVLSIPHTFRIPELAKKDISKTIAMITVALTSAFEGMNLKRGMNEIQILDLAEAIVDTSNEDYLAFEDLMLFLQKLVRGEYGLTYESMDIPKFMGMFEKYREDRWQELNRIRYEAHVQNKVNGDTGKTGKPDELSRHLASLTGRLSEMKESLKEQKEKNKKNEMDNF